MAVRIASRTLVRELGFLNRHLAGTELTPSQVHALLELERHPQTQASDLRELFRLDKSAVSRLLADLVQRGYIRASTARADKRQRALSITPKGRAQLETLHRKANRQIGDALQVLTRSQWPAIVNSLQCFADALTQSRARRGSQLKKDRDSSKHG